jgi:hypothetical protein
MPSPRTTMMKAAWSFLLGLALIGAGCNKGESSNAEAMGYETPSPESVKPMEEPVAPKAADGTPASPSPFMNTTAVDATPEGIPTTDETGRPLETIQGLQKVADYYSRVLMPNSGPRSPMEVGKKQPLPPLTDLQQLVKMRLIKQVPAAPAGKKFVIEGGVVKMVDQ